MKLCLLALTGFGNAVIEKLIDSPVIDDIVVYTRREKGKFPYYECEQLTDFCKHNRIRTHIDISMNSSDAYEGLKNFEPDMIIVSTFDQKIPGRIIDLPVLKTINIHPSLLPRYRGPTPTNWIIINGEKHSGVTFHVIDEEFDMGDILFQQKISTDGLTDGELRRKSAILSAEMLEPFFNMYIEGRLEPITQSKEQGSYYPKITSKEGIDLLKSEKFDRHNIIRGLTPYPGIEIIS
ncbi:MAG: hypothetical protein GY749_45190 [Desulfobacteraceae bacterium]|nr:hypothetical protein [Desulfobacteraceae bacterium]